jgi:hypothetical protein
MADYREFVGFPSSVYPTKSCQFLNSNSSLSELIWTSGLSFINVLAGLALVREITRNQSKKT